MTRPGYPTDLSDAEWELIRPDVSKRSNRGKPQHYDLREITNAIVYVIVTGTQWRNIPKDFPPWRTVYWHFMKWRDSDRFKDLHDKLRRNLRVRLGRESEPSAGVIDSQTVKSTLAAESVGFDAGKKVKGRKRHLLVDTLGLLVVLCIHSASIQDRDGAWFVLTSDDVPNRLEKVWADKGYAGPKAAAAAKQGGVEIEIIRNPDPHHFCITHHRWVVERTNAWIAAARYPSGELAPLINQA